MSLMTMWTRVQPAYAANLWNEALNKRLGTEVGLHTIVECVCMCSCASDHPCIFIDLTFFLYDFFERHVVLCACALERV